MTEEEEEEVVAGVRIVDGAEVESEATAEAEEEVEAESAAEVEAEGAVGVKSATRDAVEVEVRSAKPRKRRMKVKMARRTNLRRKRRKSPSCCQMAKPCCRRRRADADPPQPLPHCRENAEKEDLPQLRRAERRILPRREAGRPRKHRLRRLLRSPPQARDLGIILTTTPLLLTRRPSPLLRPNRRRIKADRNPPREGFRKRWSPS